MLVFCAFVTVVQGLQGQERQGCLEETESLAPRWEDLVPAPGLLTCQVLERKWGSFTVGCFTLKYLGSKWYFWDLLEGIDRPRGDHYWCWVRNIWCSLASPLDTLEIFHEAVKRKFHASKMYTFDSFRLLLYEMLLFSSLLSSKQQTPSWESKQALSVGVILTYVLLETFWHLPHFSKKFLTDNTVAVLS